MRPATKTRYTPNRLSRTESGQVGYQVAATAASHEGNPASAQRLSAHRVARLACFG